MDSPRLHILVVDDSIDTTDSLVELLSLWGYDAEGCYSAATALASARARTPAVVLLDLVMPVLDGFQFAKVLRTLPGCETVPLIVNTGYSTVGSRDHARAVGIEHYLLKTSDPGLLKRLLTRVTRKTALPPIPVQIIVPVPAVSLWGERPTPRRGPASRTSSVEAILA